MLEAREKHQMVLVVPVYEVEMTGVYFKHRRRDRRRRRYPRQIPQAPHSPIATPLLGKVLLHPRNAGYPVFQDPTLTPASASTSATTATSPKAPASRTQWRRNRLHTLLLTCRRPLRISLGTRAAAHAVANAYFVCRDQPRRHRKLPGRSASSTARAIFCDPRGKIVKQASRDKDELLVAELNLEEIQKSPRHHGSSTADRRPESYGEITRTPARRRNSEAATKLLRAETIESSSLYNRTSPRSPPNAVPGAPTITPPCGSP